MKTAIAFLGLASYAYSVPEKKGNKFDSLNHTKAHTPRHAVFLRAYVIASSLWAAVAGIPSGMLVPLVSSLSTLSFAAHPFDSGSSVTTHQRGQS